MYVFYDSTGKIIGGVAASTPDVVLTKIPDGTTALYLDDATHSAVWSDMGEYTIQNGAPVSTPIPDATKLANAQQAKIASLTESLANAISTFQSSALGTAHTYLADPKSMAFLTSEYAFVRSSDYDQSTISWYTMENGMQSHTGAQIAQVFLDGRAWVKNQEAHKDTLTAQVNAATTVDAVNAVTW